MNDHNRQILKNTDAVRQIAREACRRLNKTDEILLHYFAHLDHGDSKKAVTRRELTLFGLKGDV